MFLCFHSSSGATACSTCGPNQIPKFGNSVCDYCPIGTHAIVEPLQYPKCQLCAKPEAVTTTHYIFSSPGLVPCAYRCGPGFVFPTCESPFQQFGIAFFFTFSHNKPIMFLIRGFEFVCLNFREKERHLYSVWHRGWVGFTVLNRPLLASPRTQRANAG